MRRVHQAHLPPPVGPGGDATRKLLEAPVLLAPTAGGEGAENCPVPLNSEPMDLVTAWWDRWVRLHSLQGRASERGAERGGGSGPEGTWGDHPRLLGGSEGHQFLSRGLPGAVSSPKCHGEQGSVDWQQVWGLDDHGQHYVTRAPSSLTPSASVTGPGLCDGLSFAAQPG